MYIKKTKALRYAIALFLTIGTVLSTGFLSFSGLWVIYPYTIPAIFAFFLSGVIEGKVFGVSIFKGLARLKLLTSNADKHLLFWELNKYVEISSFQNKYTCDFLKDYCAQRKKYKALKNKSNVDGEDVKEAKKRLEELKTFFYQQLKEPEHTVTSYISKELREVSLHELKSAKKSVAFLRFFWAISIIVGIVSGFVTAFAVQEAITVGLAWSLSAMALSAIIWPVALFAAIGATFLLYYVMTDIVKNDLISEACIKTFRLFKRKDKEPISAYLLRLASLSIVVIGVIGLTVFATAASGGTCWIAMQKGVKLLVPKLPTFVAYCASAILIPISFSTDLIYAFSTTFQTIDTCKKIFFSMVERAKHPLKTIISSCVNIKNNLKKTKQEETWIQFLNPFRILAQLIISPIQSFIFVGHLISVGLTTDRFFNVPPLLVAGVCTVSEGLQDFSFLTTQDEDHTDQMKDDHDHQNLLQLPLQVLFSPLLLLMGTVYWGFKNDRNKTDFFEILKNTFELPLLNLIFFPLLLPGACWDWIFKNPHNGDSSFLTSMKKSFEVHTHKAEDGEEEPFIICELSEEWREVQRPRMILQNAEKRLQTTWVDKKTANEKQTCLRQLMSKEVFNDVVLDLKEGKSFTDILIQNPKKIKNKLENFKPNINGYPYSVNRFFEQPKTWISIFNKRRNFLSKTHSTDATTLKMVRNAFSLVRN